MFGIQAFDECALRCGSEYAYTQGWDTPEKAIAGGAKWIGSGYINSPTYGQNTLYKMKWNPQKPGVHQYATDMGWAYKQVSNIKKIYDLLDTYILVYDVPKYKK
jgi:mannosyl-glycoprotein endo-beta-N-acetylglucosaminidase